MGGVVLKERKFQGESSNVLIKNSFSMLELNQEKKQNSEKQICATNREASVPGSSTFEEDVCALSDPGKNQDAISKEKIDCGTCLKESADKRGLNNHEDLVIVEDVFEEDELETPVPESGNLKVNLPEKIGGSSKGNQTVDISNHVNLLTEGQGRDDVSVARVAQEKSAGDGMVCAVTVETVNMQSEWAVEPKKNKEGNVSQGPSNAAPATQKNEALGHSLAHIFAPKEAILGPAIHLSDTLIQDSACFSALKINDLEVQYKGAPEPKTQNQEGIFSSREFGSESEIIDNWILSERKKALAERRALNKDAVAFFPLFCSHRSSSWIEDGEDWGPDLHCREGNYANDESAFSEFHRMEEDYEDDFTVHPPLRRNSAPDLEARKYSPPIMRNKGLKISKKKNKLRFG